jgi:excisionase family DNA binding protein
MEELLTIEEVARILKVSVQTVRRMIDEGELQARKIRGQWRIKREDLRNYIDGKS